MTIRGTTLIGRLAALCTLLLAFTACGGGGGSGGGGFLPPDVPVVTIDLAIITTELPEASAGAEYTALVEAEGGKKPYSEKPYMEKPYMDNHQLLIKKDNNIYNNNKEEEGKRLSPSKEMKLFLEDRKYIDKIAEILIKKSGASPNIVIGEILRFRSYWSELNKSGMKQRWELQPTFQLKKRLGTWFRNVDKFNQNKKKQIII